jgi:hypothetical protein
MEGVQVHKKDLYKFIVSQPSGLETGSSGAKPFVFEALLLGLVPFLARFCVAAWDELALRLTPAVGEADLPLVAGDMYVVFFFSSEELSFKGSVFFEIQNNRERERLE